MTLARHFLILYLLIVATLAAVSWGQDKLLQSYGGASPADDRLIAAFAAIVRERLHSLPKDDWQSSVAVLSARTGAELELFAMGDIVGPTTLADLARGHVAHMRAAKGQSWAMQQLDGSTVLALKSSEPDTPRGALEWILTLLFYAAIALVIMIWLWPLTRDLRALERSASRFGHRNWRFDIEIEKRSPIFSLAETFRKMASRIDGLIASHRDMSNAVSHEIKTPLSRMQFEIELAQRAATLEEARDRVAHVKADIHEIDDLITATLEYAILERADVALNIGNHDFSALLPIIAEHARRDLRPDVIVSTAVTGEARAVQCDLYLMESAIKNLLHNAMRFAKHEVRVRFESGPAANRLVVEDDGPGVPEGDRIRVFESFVQLHRSREVKTGFGLGLAIVKRAVEWHGGVVGVSTSTLGGARFYAEWPASRYTM